MSQEQLADALAMFGLAWTSSTIAKLERGERENISLEQYLMLVAAGSVLLSTSGPSDLLLVDDEWVEVAEVQAMRLMRHAPEQHSHGICPDCFARLTPPDRP